MPFSPQATCDLTIDVSHHQGNIDWAEIKATGIQCVMIKATQGLTKDSRWEINRDGARQQGLLVIPYCFLTAAVRRSSKPISSSKPLGWPPACRPRSIGRVTMHPAPMLSNGSASPSSK
jgi:hypothetical protein